MAALGLCAAIAGCGSVDDTVPMPSILIGTWRTDDVNYQDRYFELTAARVTIGTGAGTSERYVVSTLHEALDEHGLPYYTLEYRDSDGEDYSMAFYLEEADRGTVRLKNQRQIAWKKSRR